jgi:hypothetical protein
MQDTDQIRPLADEPNHGFGLLGGLAHSLLAEYAGAVPAVPRLHLGQNTLPNPPFPMAARVPFGDLSQGWEACSQDLAGFLEAGARSLRTQPVPQASAFSQPVRILQRVLRFDSIAMAWPSQLTARVLAGHRGATPAEPRPRVATVITVAVDRAGHTLYGWVPQAGGTADIELTGEGLTISDPIAALLLDVLLAQYEWTAKVFGPEP